MVDCFVARHEDIAFIGRLAERFEHEEVETIVVTAPETLSPEIVPYLFALLEPYDDTSIEKDILRHSNCRPLQRSGDLEPKVHHLRIAAIASSL
jgi:hypothetical protein